MIGTQDIRNKEVINIYDGKSMGYVEDIQVNLEKGTIEGLVIPEERGFFFRMGKSGDTVISWKDIRRIGEEIILVEVRDGFRDEFSEESEEKNGDDKEINATELLK